MTEVLQLVAQFGFPIVMCLLVWDQNRKLDEKFTQLLQANTEALTSTTHALNELRDIVKGV